MNNQPYRNILKHLFTLNLHRGMKLGLSNITALCAAMGNPEKKFHSVHIAGTNGKGSVSIKIAKGLESKHSRTGLYISPHISSFRERITINGNKIAEEEVIKYLTKIFDVMESLKIPATFFEVTTLLAFLYFAEQKVDYAVLETGLGGRLDATNVVTPELAVITSISLDHTEILGHSLESIAKEKAGILKPMIPVILGPRAANVPVPQDTPCINVNGVFQTYELENKAIAEAALKLLRVEQEKIKIALQVNLPCRMELVVFKGQKIVLDVAHNPDGLTQLFRSLENLNGKTKFRLVCGLSKTKDLASCLAILKNFATHMHLVEASNGRGASIETLKAILLEQRMPVDQISLHTSIKECVNVAVDSAITAKEQVVICGSFFIMSDIRHALGIDEPRDFIDMNER